MSKRVLITSRSFGQVSDEPMRTLKDNDIEITFYNDTYDEDTFVRMIGGYDALTIGAHALTEAAIAAAGRLKIVAKHGAGLDNIDLEAARRHNLLVTNVPAMNANAVADLAVGLMLDVARRISFAASQVKAGGWSRIIGTDLCFKTLGLVGFGAIARNVARRAAGFGMTILAYDPFIQTVPDEFAFVKLASFEDVVASADFLSVHVPLSDKTRNLISRTEMSNMKKGSFIINTSRGGIVNEQDLYDFVAGGHLAGAGLDVTEKEPPTGNPLLTLDAVTVLPHIGMYSVEAIGAVSLVCARNVAKVFNGEQPDYIVL